MRISFDYDGTLTNSRIANLLKSLSADKANELFVISYRFPHESREIKELFGTYIKHNNIFFLGRANSKEAKIKELSIDLHFDDDLHTVKNINALDINCTAICCGLTY